MKLLVLTSLLATAQAFTLAAPYDSLSTRSLSTRARPLKCAVPYDKTKEGDCASGTQTTAFGETPVGKPFA
eukprot:1978757-Prymnesium_polylepis.1